MTKKIRVATEKETGKQYLVNFLDIPKDGPVMVWCWGEVVGVRKSKKRFRYIHDEAKKFFKDQVEISQVEDTAGFRNKLLAQGMNFLRSQGFQVNQTRFGNYQVRR